MNVKENPKDRNLVSQWMGVINIEDLTFVIKEQPIDQFLSQIEEMENSYKNFPKELKRTEKIIREIKQNGELFPVYVETNDCSFFVMEGRHRLVAFKRLGLSLIPVAFVASLKA